MNTRGAQESAADIAMVGLGVMGRNLLLNITTHGFSAVGYDKDGDKVETRRQEGAHLSIRGAGSHGELVALLRRPRTVMLLVPAGAPVDSVIDELTPFLRPPWSGTC